MTRKKKSAHNFTEKPGCAPRSQKPPRITPAGNLQEINAEANADFLRLLSDPCYTRVTAVRQLDQWGLYKLELFLRATGHPNHPMYQEFIILQKLASIRYKALLREYLSTYGCIPSPTAYVSHSAKRISQTNPILVTKLEKELGMQDDSALPRWT